MVQGDHTAGPPWLRGRAQGEAWLQRVSQGRSVSPDVLWKQRAAAEWPLEPSHLVLLSSDFWWTWEALGESGAPQVRTADTAVPCLISASTCLCSEWPCPGSPWPPVALAPPSGPAFWALVTPHLPTIPLDERWEQPSPEGAHPLLLASRCSCSLCVHLLPLFKGPEGFPAYVR